MRPNVMGLGQCLTAAVLMATPAPAAAQNLDPPETLGATERMQSHAAWHASRAVSAHVGFLLTDRQARAAASGPVASATAGEPQWSAWIGPSVTWSDQDGGAAGNEGHTVTTYLGLDRRLGERGVLGILAGSEFSAYDTALLDGNLEAEGLGVGVYAGYAVTDMIVLDALALYSWIDSDFADRARSASYDSERLQLAANATAYLTEGQLSIRPKLGVAYTRDDQDAYRDTLGTASPETETETFSVSAGAQVGYTVFLDETSWIEPYLGLTALVEESSTDPDAGRSGDELDAFDLRLSAGLGGQLAEGVSLSISADVSGLARPGYEAVTLGGQLSVRF